MRDILIVLTMCVAAIAVGVLFYFYGPSEMQEPVVSEVAVEASEQTAPILEEDVRIVVLESGTNAGAAPARKNVAAYDAEGLERLWQMAHGNDGTPAPFVDFSTQYVIGVFAGTRQSGGHAIAVSSVRDMKDARTVTITLTKPGETCVVSQALTSPYQIVAVPLSDLSLTKIERTEESSCR